MIIIKAKGLPIAAGKEKPGLILELHGVRLTGENWRTHEIILLALNIWWTLRILRHKRK
jgi:hypothetical protein